MVDKSLTGPEIYKIIYPPIKLIKRLADSQHRFRDDLTASLYKAEKIKQSKEELEKLLKDRALSDEKQKEIKDEFNKLTGDDMSAAEVILNTNRIEIDYLDAENKELQDKINMYKDSIKDDPTLTIDDLRRASDVELARLSFNNASNEVLSKTYYDELKDAITNQNKDIVGKNSKIAKFSKLLDPIDDTLNELGYNNLNTNIGGIKLTKEIAGIVSDVAEKLRKTVSIPIGNLFLNLLSTKGTSFMTKRRFLKKNGNEDIMKFIISHYNDTLTEEDKKGMGSLIKKLDTIKGFITAVKEKTPENIFELIKESLDDFFNDIDKKASKVLMSAIESETENIKKIDDQIDRIEYRIKVIDESVKARNENIQKVNPVDRDIIKQLQEAKDLNNKRKDEIRSTDSEIRTLLASYPDIKKIDQRISELRVAPKIEYEDEEKLSLGEMVKRANKLLRPHNQRIILFEEISKYNSITELLGPDPVVIILYRTKSDYGHWVGLGRNKRGLYYFDSYGRMIDRTIKSINPKFKKATGQDSPHLLKLLSEAHSPVHYNNVQLQSFNKGIATCGRWVGYYMNRIRRGDTIDSINKMFTEYEGDKDELIVDLTDPYL